MTENKIFSVKELKEQGFNEQEAEVMRKFDRLHNKWVREGKLSNQDWKRSEAMAKYLRI